jgi:hypothetical protein
MNFAPLDSSRQGASFDTRIRKKKIQISISKIFGAKEAP